MTAGGVRRLEVGRVDGARRRDQLVAPGGGVRVEQAARAIEPPAGRAREDAHLLVGALGRLRRRSTRAPRASESRRNGTSWQRERIVGGSGPSSPATRTMTAYGGGSSRSLSSASAASSFIRSRVEDEVDAPVGLERPHVQVVAQRPDVVDPDHLAERLQEVEVGMRARLDAPLVAEQGGRERERCRPLPDAGRARGGGTRARRRRPAPPSAAASPRAAQVRTRRAPYTSSASSSAGRVASSTTIRSGKRAASSR